MEEKERMVLEAMEKAGRLLRPGDVAKTVGLAKDEVSKIIISLKKERKNRLSQKMLLRANQIITRVLRKHNKRRSFCCSLIFLVGARSRNRT